ncbi:MAG: M64 family metallopeptidase [Acidobacteriota bacterium]
MIRTLSAILFVTVLLLNALPAAADFDDHFTGRSLRFDYFHTGTAGEEHISLDELRLESDWPGSRIQLIDGTGLGKYRFEVTEAGGGAVLYSRGFASIYGEWETIGEARQGNWRTFHESQRFPEPKQPVDLVLHKRQGDGTFAEIFRRTVDPAHRSVNRSPLEPVGTPWTVFEHGPPAKKVDLLVLGDGYTAAEMSTFRDDVKSLMDHLFTTAPFDHHKKDFNVRAIDLPSRESGVTKPREDVWRNSPLGLSYNAFDSERYILTYSNRALREAAALAPYDALILLANQRKYGGGGIFNLWTTAAAGSGEAPYLVVHEFGHSFAGLGDEYYTSQVSYEDFTAPGTEPWSPNVTALLDPENLKWRHLVTAETPIPTPWDQDEYDTLSLAYQEKRQKLRAEGASEEEMEALFDEVKAQTIPFLGAQEHAGKVGAFEGAGYQAKGLYRPALDCIMFTRNPKTFCPVCSEGIGRVIALYTE